MDTNILLETGTNELEVLEFQVAGNSYGINVAKVKEIIPYQNVTPIPNAHPSIEGIFMPRDDMITAIDLRNCLALGSSEPGGLFIVTNFNNLDIAFHVDAVMGIHRVSWGDIINPDATIAHAQDGVSTGIIKIDGKLIIILDFERIVTYINPNTGLRSEDLEHIEPNEKRGDFQILIAEDSLLLNTLLVSCLEKAGYTRIISTKNGRDCYEKIMDYSQKGILEKMVNLVITDIEMPIMDGHHLLKLLKDSSSTKNIPVILFSSLVNDEMKKKGEELGADAQLSKPEIGDLIRVIDGFLLN